MDNLKWENVRQYIPGISKNDWNDKVLAKIDIKNRDECWEWKATNKKKNGFHVTNRPNNKRVHYIVYGVFNNIKLTHLQGLKIRRKCNNRKCCNPDHLYVDVNAKINPQDHYEKSPVREYGPNSDLVRMYNYRERIKCGETTLEELKKEHGDVVIERIMSLN